VGQQVLNSYAVIYQGQVVPSSSRARVVKGSVPPAVSGKTTSAVSHLDPASYGESGVDRHRYLMRSVGPARRVQHRLTCPLCPDHSRETILRDQRVDPRRQALNALTRRPYAATGSSRRHKGTPSR
jgi:hypothetical protein